MKLVQVRLIDFSNEDGRMGGHGGYYNYEFAVTDLEGTNIIVDDVTFGVGRRNYSTLRKELQVLAEIE